MKDNFVNDVRAKANGHWEAILQHLDIPVNRTESACPACGGSTRYRFDDRDGRGTYHCSHCGAGTGLDLVMKVKQCGVRDAAALVADAITLPLPEPKPAREKPQVSIADKVAALVAKSTLGQSQYLTAKGLLCPFSVLTDGSLLMVLTNADTEITGAQVIKPDGSKRLVSGTVKKGSFCVVNSGGSPETVIIAEGLATALSVHLMHPDVITVAAIDAGNLLPVAQVMRRIHPEARIIIAADNDIKPDEPNIGKEFAEKAAKSVSGWLTLPPTEHKADWNDYHQQNGLEAATRAFNDSMYQPESKSVSAKFKVVDGGKKRRREEINLIQMADNEKALLLSSRYDGIAIHSESEVVYLYREGVWEKASPLDLSREMVEIYNENQTNFNKRTINNVIDALKLVIPKMGEPKLSLIPFANGVYDIETGQFTEHSADNWLSSHNGVEYTPPVIGENLRDHAPNFHKWLSHAADSDALKMRRIAAALFMVLANRFDWQLFLEITGDGGSGKSVFTQVATLLAGKNNTASGNMAALDDAGGRAQFAGKRLITLPDQPKYTGEGTGIKAITGGDAMEINPKYEKQYTAVLRAVVIATNNTPMIFTERSGGVSRRRVIFQFNNPVSEDERDPELSEKIAAEIPVIVRRLLVNFCDPEKARQLLLEQRNSLEALEVKRASNPVIDLCAVLAFMGEPHGLKMGGGKKSETDRQPRKYLYHFYLSFMDYMGLSRPLSVIEFAKAIKEAAKEYGGEYKTRTVNGRRQTNVELTDKAEEFL